MIVQWHVFIHHESFFSHEAADGTIRFHPFWIKQQLLLPIWNTCRKTFLVFGKIMTGSEGFQLSQREEGILPGESFAHSTGVYLYRTSGDFGKPVYPLND